MAWCHQCGAEYVEGITTCAKCNVDLLEEPPDGKQVKLNIKRERKEAKGFWSREISPGQSVWACMLVIALVVFGLLLGNYHIVQSGSGTKYVRKVHFTLAETFVSMDAITGMPSIAASAKYPLAIKALQRDGLLESATAREERLDAEVQAEMQEAQEQVNRDMADMRKQMGW